MRSRGLRVLIALVVLTVLALWLWRPGSAAKAIDAGAAAQETSNQASDLSPVASEPDAARLPASTPETSIPSFTAGSAEEFEFDLTVIPIDGSGRPLASVEVRVGFELHALALLGKTEWNGELHAQWRSLEPTADFVFEARRDGMGSSTLRHVHLVANRATTVRLSIDNDSVPVLIGNELLSGLPQGNAGESRLDSGVEFTHDNAGRGVFLDPTLLRIRVKPAPRALEMNEQNESTRELSRAMQPLLVAKVSADFADILANLDKCKAKVTVRDEEGKPVSGASVEVMTEAYAFRTGRQTGGNGSTEIGMPAGRVMVVAGGGTHAIVREDLDVAEGETREIEVRCPTIARTRVRLLDREHRPLVGWHLESRQTDSEGTFVDRGDTNAEGRGELVIPVANRGELFVRPVGAGAMPKLHVDTRNFDPDADNEIVLGTDVRPAHLYATIIAAGTDLEVRLWNLASDEGMRLPRMDVKNEDGSDTQTHVFRADTLLPGTYMLEIGAPCVEWKRVGPFLVAGGQVLDAGTYSFEQPAKLQITGLVPASAAVLTAHTLVHGLRVESKLTVSHEDDEIWVTPGAWTLSAKSTQAQDQEFPITPASIEARSGAALVLDLTGKNPPR